MQLRWADQAYALLQCTDTSGLAQYMSFRAWILCCRQSKNVCDVVAILDASITGSGTAMSTVVSELCSHLGVYIQAWLCTISSLANRCVPLMLQGETLVSALHHLHPWVASSHQPHTLCRGIFQVAHLFCLGLLAARPFGALSFKTGNFSPLLARPDKAPASQAWIISQLLIIGQAVPRAMLPAGDCCSSEAGEHERSLGSKEIICNLSSSNSQWYHLRARGKPLASGHRVAGRTF